MSVNELHKTERDMIYEILARLAKGCPVCKYQLDNDYSCVNMSIHFKRNNECPPALQRRCGKYITAKVKFIHELKNLLILIDNAEKDDRHEGH